MKRLLLLYAINVLIVSMCALPQDDASQVQSTAAEPESAGDVPISDSSVGEASADELSAEELLDDDVKGQGRGGQEPQKPPYGNPQPEKPKPEKPSKPEKPWIRPGLACTAYTEAGKNQRQEAIDVCLKKGLDKEECVKKFCSAANGPTLGCNENCTRCPYSNQYNNKEKC